MGDDSNWRSRRSHQSSTFPNKTTTTKWTTPRRDNWRTDELPSTSTKSRYLPNNETSFPATNKKTERLNIEKKQHRQEVIYRIKMLEELSDKDSLDIIVELTGNQSGFDQLLESTLSNDMLVLVIKTLAKICSSDFVNGKTLIATLACKENLHKLLQGFLLGLLIQTEVDRKLSSYYWNEPETFFINSRNIFLYLLKSIPSKACDVLPKTLKAFNVLLANSPNNDIKQQFEQLEKELEHCKTEKEKKVCASDDYPDEDPPNDFRYLSVYPTKEDLDEKPEYLRKNVIDKSYSGINHYLDVQFRLLKEDFVGPLRNGIAEYIRNSAKNKAVIKTSGARVYTNVTFLRPKPLQGQIGVLLQFQSMGQKRKNVNPMNKRFMYGSLLCFTKDNFQTQFFGKVIERSIDLLTQGQIVVGFQSNDQSYLLGQPYIMVESFVYFEPYFHVLRALQNMEEEQFPMKKYIIDLNPVIDDVSYLNTSSVYTIIENSSVSLFHPTSWPNADVLKLNASQYSALQMALTKELVVIQGPPGTGKTYLGLKIARTLIENKSKWYRSSLFW